MDKLKKQKHDHKLTDWLKFGIFAIIMLAPFFSIGGRMAYTIFNKNAKDSYTGEKINAIDYESTQIDNFVLGKNYLFNFQNLVTAPTTSGATDINYDTLKINNTTYINGRLRFYISNNILRYQIDNNSSETATDKLIYLTYNSLGTTINTTLNSYLDNYLYKVIYNDNYYLDNAFDYSISKIAEEPVFNWVKNTAVYDGINAMFTGLEYETDTNPIAIMCAYWLLNTAVYIVIDIVIWAFTKMTHMFVQE